MTRKDTNRGNYAVMVLLLIFLAVFSTSSIKAQSQQPTLEQLWISIPSSPLELDFNSNSRFSMLYNRSLGTVVGYRVGCVVGLEANKVRIVRKAKPVNTKLEPDKVLMNSISVHIEEIERCYKHNSQLAVIEVRFQDGSAWKAASR